MSMHVLYVSLSEQCITFFFFYLCLTNKNYQYFFIDHCCRSCVLWFSISNGILYRIWCCNNAMHDKKKSLSFFFSCETFIFSHTKREYGKNKNYAVDWMFYGMKLYNVACTVFRQHVARFSLFTVNFEQTTKKEEQTQNHPTSSRGLCILCTLS